MSLNVNVLFTLALCCATAAAQAQDGGEVVTLHGFGGWAYGKTDHNNYLAGLPEGDYRHSSMALNLGARVDDHLTIRVQGEIREADDASQAALSYAFADYRVSERLSIRIGQVKHPFGISTEVFSVGTLRPFLDLPQGVYGPVGFAGESYKGVGLSGTVANDRWALDYDAYGGGNDLTKLHVPEEFYRGGTLQDVSKESEVVSTRNEVGSRLVLHLPLPGLRVGLSAYSGIIDEPVASRRTVIGAEFDYRTNAFSLQAEYAHLHEVGDEVATGAYLQAAYRLTPVWQVATQYDYLENRFPGLSTSTAPSLQFHREGAVALNYWLSRALVVKTEFHLVNGNLFAAPHPEDLVAVINAGELKTTTRLFQFGGQFSY